MLPQILKSRLRGLSAFPTASSEFYGAEKFDSRFQSQRDFEDLFIFLWTQVFFVVGLSAFKLVWRTSRDLRPSLEAGRIQEF